MPGSKREPFDTSTSTSDLLERARAGDQDALNALFERHMPLLQRWASGRLPRWARDLADTTDLVQETVIATLKHLDHFDDRGEGALQAYLRQAVLNRIRNEIRRLSSRGTRVDVDSQLEDPAASPLDVAATQQRLALYDAALQRLKSEEREAIVARLELGLSYGEIAELLGKPSANAARMAVVRALLRLADEMR